MDSKIAPIFEGAISDGLVTNSWKPLEDTFTMIITNNTASSLTFNLQGGYDSVFNTIKDLNGDAFAWTVAAGASETFPISGATAGKTIDGLQYRLKNVTVGAVGKIKVIVFA